MSIAAWLIWPLICLFAAILAHGVLLRLPTRIDLVRKFLLVGTPIGLMLVAGLLTRYGVSSFTLAGISLYAFLCELYLFFSTLVISSVSVAMLLLLYKSPVPESELIRVHEPREMVQLRVDRLLANGFLTRSGDQLLLTEKGRRLHHTFQRLRTFFCHGDAR